MELAIGFENVRFDKTALLRDLSEKHGSKTISPELLEVRLKAMAP
jgi:hypothetical protein